MTSSGRQKMVMKGAALGAALVASVCLPSAGRAQELMSQVEAAQKLAEIRIWNAQLLEAKPALVDVEAAISGDCRAKLPAEADFVTYCSCARAVVMYLWMNSGSEPMQARVETYAANPSSMTPADFLKYQGPELYKPFCDLALGTT